ncbi:MAG: hypothetical protein KOO65_12380 [Desulfobacterales bacterium]|nr:hypothetical protein [Desulfobacterales bacterium]
MGLWQRTKKLLILAVIIGLTLWLLPAFFHIFFSRPQSEIFVYSFISGGTIIGFCVYKFAYYQWSENSKDDDAMWIGEVKYKAIAIDNLHSWRMALEKFPYSINKEKAIEMFEGLCEELKEEKY